MNTRLAADDTELVRLHKRRVSDAFIIACGPRLNR